MTFLPILVHPEMFGVGWKGLQGYPLNPPLATIHNRSVKFMTKSNKYCHNSIATLALVRRQMSADWSSGACYHQGTHLCHQTTCNVFSLMAWHAQQFPCTAIACWLKPAIAPNTNCGDFIGINHYINIIIIIIIIYSLIKLRYKQDRCAVGEQDRLGSLSTYSDPS